MVDRSGKTSIVDIIFSGFHVKFSFHISSTGNSTR